MPRTIASLLIIIVIIALPLVGQSPVKFPAVIVYGDSYSDNGNIYRVLDYPGPPYWNGRFSNGPVAVEDLAFSLAVPLFDYAWGGATTGVGNVVDGGTPEQLGNRGLPGMTKSEQTTRYSIPPALVHNALWVVWGSPNDFQADGYTNSTAEAAVERVVAIVADLQRLGARRILVPGMGDLGVVPEYIAQGPQVVQLVHNLSIYFNQRLLAALPRGVLYYNTFGLYDRMVANPSAYGLTDVTDPCYSDGIVCPNPDQYLFWDGAHPTAHVHSILAQRYYATALGGLPPP